MNENYHSNEVKATIPRATILLVDDDPSLLRLLSIRLTAAGYEVAAVESGEQALAWLAASRPHLVITDLRMGGMDGIALLEVIQQRYSTIPVIILTAHGTIPEAVNATKRGVFSFLTKPFDGKLLLEVIANALKLSADTLQVDADQAAAEWRREITTRSPVMEDLLSQAKLVAESDSSVFICGESGAGKELLARAIHQASPRVLRG